MFLTLIIGHFRSLPSALSTHSLIYLTLVRFWISTLFLDKKSWNLYFCANMNNHWLKVLYGTSLYKNTYSALDRRSSGRPHPTQICVGQPKLQFGSSRWATSLLSLVLHEKWSLIKLHYVWLDIIIISFKSHVLLSNKLTSILNVLLVCNYGVCITVEVDRQTFSVGLPKSWTDDPTCIFGCPLANPRIWICLMHCQVQIFQWICSLNYLDTT